VFGLIGVFSRYIIGSVFRHESHAFPWETFGINLFGCFLIGIVYVYGVEKSVLSEDLKVGLLVGLLGGFTTFSAYGLETAVLIKNGQAVLGLVYAISSSVFGVLLTFAGIYLSRSLTR